jgi:hypothetical protein
MRGLVGFATIGVLAIGAPGPLGAAEACPQPEGALREVVTVPEAFVLGLGDGRQVRLAGTLLPTADGNGSAAARAALAALAVGKSVRLGEAAAAPDRYGRVAARVVRAADGVDLAESLVGAGMALAGGALDGPCGARLLAAEASARAGRRGGWGSGLLAVDRADDPELAGRAGRYAVVEGRVESVGHAGRTHYLNFGRRWTLDFTVIIAESDARRLAAVGLDPARLAGRVVRVRGWLESRDGAVVRVAGPGGIERVDGPLPVGGGE